MNIPAIEDLSDGNKKVARSKRYTRYILDPFQIFCIEKRNEYMKAHPELKNSEVTSILAGIWREMSENDKMQYNLIAMKLQNNKCKVERKIKKNLPRSDSSKESKGSSTPEISEPDVEADGNPAFKTSNPPKIYIISRTGLGEDLSEVSYNLLKMQEKCYDE